MSPQDAIALEQRDSQQDKTAEALYLDGATDAAMGEPPQRKDDLYLTGYLARLRELIVQKDQYTLQIRWLSKPYRLGAYDDPNPCQCEEF